MDSRTIELRVGGQSYRIVSSSSEEDLRRLAAAVSAKLTQLSRTDRARPSDVMFLAAMASAYDVEEERARREWLNDRVHDVLTRALVRIDAALEPLSAVGGGDPPR